MPSPSLVAKSRMETGHAAPASGSSAKHALLRDCLDLYCSVSIGLGKLSIETSNDLFEMDPRVTPENVHDFRSKRGEWVKRFDAALRDLFERRLSGQRRKGRRPDPVQSLSSLRVMNDSDTSSQRALATASRRLAEAAKQELGALDYRVSVLLDEPPGREVDNPFSPAYLLDAIGVTSRSLYPEARVWRPLMERVIGDFVPAVNKTYIQLNRFLTERGILPDIGAVLRARSDLRPADDRQLLPLFNRLLNEVKPTSRQAWRNLDLDAAKAAGYALAPLPVNPYAGDAGNVPRRAASDAGHFPQLDRMMASGPLQPVLERLDHWQHNDPMTEYLRLRPPAGIDTRVTPVNRIPWIHAATASMLPGESERTAMDVVGFVFDYIFRDPSITPRFRKLYEGLQLPILKAALADPSFFTDSRHAARRLLERLADAAIGADDDEAYGDALVHVATSMIRAVRAEYVLDADVFVFGCETLEKFNDEWQKRGWAAMQSSVDEALAAETRDAHRSRVRVLIRDKLAGAHIPFDVRAFVGTVWADYLTKVRQADGSRSDSNRGAVKTLDDMLWSICANGRTAQRAALSAMIPSIVRRLRAGGAAVQVDNEKMTRFLAVLYDLHIAAIKPGAGQVPAAYDNLGSPMPAFLARKKMGNLHDFVADLVLGTWLAFDQDGTRVKARLSWISPWRATYIFSNRSGTSVTVLTPEELAWEMSAGRVTLIVEPVPLFDRAVSVTLDYLAEQNAKNGPSAKDAAAGAPAARTRSPVVATG